MVKRKRTPGALDIAQRLLQSNPDNEEWLEKLRQRAHEQVEKSGHAELAEKIAGELEEEILAADRRTLFGTSSQRPLAASNSRPAPREAPSSKKPGKEDLKEELSAQGPSGAQLVGQSTAQHVPTNELQTTASSPQRLPTGKRDSNKRQRQKPNGQR